MRKRSSTLTSVAIAKYLPLRRNCSPHTTGPHACVHQDSCTSKTSPLHTPCVDGSQLARAFSRHHGNQDRVCHRSANTLLVGSSTSRRSERRRLNERSISAIFA